MNKIIPFFEINGIKYEIKKTRYLMDEFDKLKYISTPQEQIVASTIQSMTAEIDEYKTKVKELQDKFYETYDEQDKKKYLAVKSLLDDACNKLIEYRANNAGVDTISAGINKFEQIAIKGLAEQHFNNDMDKAKKCWESFVSDKGNDYTIEWLSNMIECLFMDKEEDDDNSFLSQMRARANKTANNRKNR